MSVHPQAAASTPLANYQASKELAQIRQQRRVVQAQVHLSKCGTKSHSHYLSELKKSQHGN